MRLEPERKLLQWDAVATVAENLRRAGRRIVTTNGCFDLLHWGHIKYLSEARALGDVLFVGLNSDASVRRLKGADRPFWDENIRARQLAGLEAVDGVTIFQEDTPEKFLELVRPAIHVKGGDYEGKDFPERRLMEKLGGRVECVAFVPGFSSTSMLEKLRR